MRVNEHSLSVLDLIAAKLGGAKYLIMRSSNSNSAGGRISKILHKLFLFLPRTIPNIKIAPSSEAAIYTFGKKQLKKGKVKILKNAIEYEQFVYNSQKREDIRKKLGVDDKIVIGHIGRFNEQKNHKFLIEVFKEIAEKNDKCLLLLVGDGTLMDKTKEQVKAMNLDKKVLFLGVRKDVPELLMGMDVFVFPSFYEGMPNTVIEAQSAGLKCLISDSITKEAKITPLVEYVSLDENAKEWANKVLENIDYVRENQTQRIIDNGYEIKSTCQQFLEMIKFDNP